MGSPLKREAEFVAVMASLMAMAAMAIDIILPALSDIRDHFQAPGQNSGQWMIVIFLIGFGISQPLFGSLTDRFGRKPFLAAALLIYAVMALFCAFAPSYELLLAARMGQGLAAGGVRVIATSSVRDLYTGRNMARIMSMTMIVFMAVPIFAPALGQAIQLMAGDWRPIFWFLGLYAAIIMLWSWFKLGETLPVSRRQSLTWPAILASYKRVLTSRRTIGYAFANGMVFGIMFSLIISSEQVFRHIYHAEHWFPFYFAGGGFAMIAANFFNARSVMRLGMRRVSHSAVCLLLGSSVFHAVLALLFGGSAPLLVFYPMFLLVFFCVGLCGPNFNALAMEEVGDIAGVASALLGCIATLSAGIMGGVSGQIYNGQTVMLLWYNAGLALIALLLVLVTERFSLFGSRA